MALDRFSVIMDKISLPIFDKSVALISASERAFDTAFINSFMESVIACLSII